MKHARGWARLMLGALLFAPLFGCAESPENLSARLRRECTAIVDEALKEKATSPLEFVRESTRRDMIAQCILERGRTGR